MTAPTTIHLLKPHRHAGRNYPAGAPLTLPARKAQWLVALGVARANDYSPLQGIGVATAATTPKKTTRRGEKSCQGQHG